MNLRIENKGKVIAYLIVLGPLLAYSIYTNLLSGPSTPASSNSAPRASLPAPTASVPQSAGPPTAPRTTTSRSRSEEFRPVLRSKRGSETQIDPARIDPTLRLDLLAKVQAVELAGGSRNVFQFGAPPAAEVKPLAGKEPVVARPFVGPRPPPPPTPTAPKVEAPPPPIPLKFYGYSTASNNGRKTAYFLHNDDIILAAEGETVERRYRVVRINATSVVMEDTEVKKQQTLPLVEEGLPG